MIDILPATSFLTYEALALARPDIAWMGNVRLATTRLEDYAYASRLPASVLDREIFERGHQGGMSQLRAYILSPRPRLPSESEVRFETALTSSDMMDLETIHHAGWSPRSTNTVSASACASRRPATPASRACETSRNQTMTNGSSR